MFEVVKISKDKSSYLCMTEKVSDLRGRYIKTYCIVRRVNRRYSVGCGGCDALKKLGVCSLMPYDNKKITNEIYFGSNLMSGASTMCFICIDSNSLERIPNTGIEIIGIGRELSLFISRFLLYEM